MAVAATGHFSRGDVLRGVRVAQSLIGDVEFGNPDFCRRGHRRSLFRGRGIGRLIGGMLAGRPIYRHADPSSIEPHRSQDGGVTRRVMKCTENTWPIRPPRTNMLIVHE